MNQEQINWQEIESWLLKMEPELLDNRPFIMQDIRGKNIEMASPKEEWYSYMIRAKGGLNKPKELLEVLESARKQNIKWHYNNDIWFARKEAFALKALNQIKKAENILRRIVKFKKDWFLLYDLALVVEKEEESLQLMAQAALLPGKDEHKVKLFQSIHDQLHKSKSHLKEAALHLCLILALREENNWPLNDEMIKLVQNQGINLKDLGSSSAIKRDLIPWWNKLGKPDKVRQSGKIEIIFPNNKAGFIFSNGERYYFKTGKLEGKLTKNTMVSFELEEGFDKKKNKPSKEAVKIELLA